MSDEWRAPTASTIPTAHPDTSYRPLGALTLAVTAAVGVGQVANVMLSAANLAPSGDATDLLIGLLALAIFGAILIGLPLWCMWHVRAARNLVAMGVVLVHSPGWHAGYWFIPFVNLVLPYRAMCELMERSAPDESQGSTSKEVWWGLWLGGNIISNLSVRISTINIEIGQMLDWIALPLSVGAALLYLSYIRQVDRDQSERFARG